MDKNFIRKFPFVLTIVFILYIIFSFLKPPSVGMDIGHYKSDPFFAKDCLKENKEVLVKAVCDGDTISLTSCKNDQKRNKIRLIGIDAFELGQKPYGELGKKFLTDRVLSKKVCIELDKEEEDKYGRTLGYVFLRGSRGFDEKQNSITSPTSQTSQAPETFFINEELIKNGLAIVYSFPPNTKYTNDLKDAQIYARKSMVGIWKDSDYIRETPYEFRHKKATK